MPLQPPEVCDAKFLSSPRSFSFKTSRILAGDARGGNDLGANGIFAVTSGADRRAKWGGGPLKAQGLYSQPPDRSSNGRIFMNASTA